MAHTPVVLTDFLVDWNDSVPGAADRAHALVQTCEHDLARLCPLFGISGAFGPQDRIKVVVDNVSGGLGSNSGYEAGGNTNITVTPFSTAASPADADGGARAAFVAELAEVLMTYRNQQLGTTTWNPGDSTGEGLSAVCAATLYPDAYYTPALGLGPRVNQWFAPPPPQPGQPPPPPRPNWVDQTEPTDTDYVSFGCAILFINYLTTQLPYSLHRVITCDGVTLADKYHTLTGLTDGWNAFRTLLLGFFPGPTLLPTDNPFPLLDPARRTVTLYRTADEQTDGPVESSGSAQLRPCLLSPEGTYRYDRLDQASSVTLTASTYGFGAPSFGWTVNDVVLSQYYGTDNPLSVTAEVGTEDPNAPGIYNFTSQDIDVAYTISNATSWHGPASALQIRNTDHPGREDLVVTVHVHDLYDNPAVIATDGTWADLQTQRIQYEPRYYTDKQHCEAELHDFLRRHVHFRNLNLLLTLPDPAPHTELLRVAQHAIDELAALARDDPQMAEAIANAIAKRLQVPPALLGRAGPAPD